MVLQSHPPDAPAVAGDEDQAETLRFIQINRAEKILRHALFLEPLGAAHQDFRPVNLRADAPPGGFGKILRFEQRNPRFAGQLGQGLGGGMVAVFFRRGGQAQQLGGGRAAQRGQAADHQPAGGERAGLVKYKGIDARRQFDVADVLDENAQAGRGGERRHHGAGRGQDEGARAGDDEDGDDPAQIVGEGPDQRANHQHQRRVKAHVLVNDAHDGQLGFFRRQDQVAHFAQGRVLPGAGHPDLQRARQILRAGENFVPGLLVHGQRFAGDVRLVEGTLAADDDAVRRHIVAGPHADDIADGQEFGVHFLLALLGDAPGFGRGQFDERFDGSAGAFGGAGFDDLAQQHEEGDHAGFLIMARTKGDGDRQGDQFIGGEEAAPQIHEGGEQNGIAQDHGADHGAGRRDGVRGALEKTGHPVDGKGVDDEKQADERLRQGQHGVAVVVLVAVRGRNPGRMRRGRSCSSRLNSEVTCIG